MSYKPHSEASLRAGLVSVSHPDLVELVVRISSEHAHVRPSVDAFLRDRAPIPTSRVRAGPLPLTPQQSALHSAPPPPKGLSSRIALSNESRQLLVARYHAPKSAPTLRLKAADIRLIGKAISVYDFFVLTTMGPAAGFALTRQSSEMSIAWQGLFKAMTKTILPRVTAAHLFENRDTSDKARYASDNANPNTNTNDDAFAYHNPNAKVRV